MNSSLTRTAEEELAALRRGNITAAADRKKELFARFPRLNELDLLRREQVSALFRAKAQKTETAAIESRIAQLDQEIHNFLAEQQIAPDYLDVQFACPRCQDTGVIDTESGSERCSCFKQRLLDAAYKDNRIEGAKNQTFERFDHTLFTEESSSAPRADIQKIVAYCEKYADQFPRNPRKNILLTGQTGAGKTFLMNCIAARVLQNGHNALLISAGRLFDQLRRYAFSQCDGIDELLEVDLLLIDDLGTEPLFNNTTMEYLFMLFNDRTRMGKHLVITTNLTAAQLDVRYTDRITSRILDQNATVVLQVNGRDLRLQGK